MKLNIFIYVVLNLIIFQLVGINESWSIRGLEVLCILGIATFGIAHGAIDHVLYKLKGKSKQTGYVQFIIRYILVAILFSLLWYTLPSVALILFLIISAYHFGQSQFVDSVKGSKFLSSMLYLSWGGLVVGFMFLFNQAEFKKITPDDATIASILDWIINYAVIFTIVFAAIFATLLLYEVYKNRFHEHNWALELFILALIACSFYLLPVFIAFSLFFVVIHSSKVIAQEHEFCKKMMKIKTNWSFIKLFLPLTMVSLAAVFIVYAFVYVWLGRSDLLGFALLVLLSSVTIPHAFVMEKFYAKG